MKISIITAVYNRAATIADTIGSVRSQTYADIEHVVQDGGSTDGTVAVLERHAAPRMRVESASDGGLYDGVNKGILRANGDVIGLLHSDDVFAADDVIARMVEILAGADGVYGDLVYVSAADPARVIRYWRAGPYQRGRLAWGWMPPHPTLYLKRHVLQRWGAYDIGFDIAADYEAMLRWLVRGRIRLAYLPRPMVRMRTGGASNRSLDRIIRKSREDYRAMRRHGVGGLGTLLCKNISKLGQFVRREG